MSSPVRRGLVIILLILGTLVAIELVVRFVLWEPFNPWERYRLEQNQDISPLGVVDTNFSPIGLGDLVPNQDGIWTFNPDLPYHVKTNSLGFRNSQELNEQDDVIRILAIGDSFTFGPHVNNEDTWSAWLETLLNRQFFPDQVFQVLNAGFPGYTITDEIAYLKDKGLAVEPDLIILNVTPNDVRDFAPDKRAKFSRPKNRKIEENNDLVNPLRQFLEDHSATFQLTRILRFQATLQDMAELLQDNELAIESIDMDNPISDKTLERLQLYDEYLATYETHFAEFVTLVDDNAIPLLVVYFPTVDQLPADASTIQQDNLVRMTSSNNVPFLDLLPHYREVGDDLSLYLYTYDTELGYVGDGHPSRYGHYVSAHTIAKFLIDANFLSTQ